MLNSKTYVSRSDGLLIDVSEIAAEVGFKMPVAVTKSLWEK